MRRSLKIKAIKKSKTSVGKSRKSKSRKSKSKKKSKSGGGSAAADAAFLSCKIRQINQRNKGICWLLAGRMLLMWAHRVWGIHMTTRSVQFIEDLQSIPSAPINTCPMIPSMVLHTMKLLCGFKPLRIHTEWIADVFENQCVNYSYAGGHTEELVASMLLGGNEQVFLVKHSAALHHGVEGDNTSAVTNMQLPDWIPLVGPSYSTPLEQSCGQDTGMDEWDMDRVGKWIRSLQLGVLTDTYVAVFAENSIDGIKLGQLTKERLMKELGVASIDHCNRILEGVQLQRQEAFTAVCDHHLYQRRWWQDSFWENGSHQPSHKHRLGGMWSVPHNLLHRGTNYRMLVQDYYLLANPTKVKGFHHGSWLLMENSLLGSDYEKSEDPDIWNGVVSPHNMWGARRNFSKQMRYITAMLEAIHAKVNRNKHNTDPWVPDLIGGIISVSLKLKTPGPHHVEIEYGLWEVGHTISFVHCKDGIRYCNSWKNTLDCHPDMSTVLSKPEFSELSDIKSMTVLVNHSHADHAKRQEHHDKELSRMELLDHRQW